MNGTNIFEHVIDDASTVKVRTSQTNFIGGDVQSCLEEIDIHALSPLPTTPTASESVAGISFVATESDMLNSSIDDKVVTPLKLNYWLVNAAQATETTLGLAQIASNDEMSDIINDIRIVTPEKLNYYADNIRIATETRSGFFRLATESEAISGTGDGVMTPEKTLAAINAWAVGSASQATETTKGLIRIATNSEVNNISNNNIAITPSNLNYRTATETRRGAFYISNQTIADARTSTEHAVTVGTIDQFIGNDSKAGFVKLVNNLTTNDTTAALTASMGKQLFDDKLTGNGGEVIGDLIVNNMKSLNNGADIISNGLFTSQSLLNGRPVGSLYFSVDNANPSSLFGGVWEKYAEGLVIIGSGTHTDINGETKTFLTGETGGEYRHKITEQEMPKHHHATMGEAYAWEFGHYNSSRGHLGLRDSDRDNYLYNTSTEGGDQPHNNMQPYIVVNIWRRTA